jgi:hypothetical protein
MKTVHLSLLAFALLGLPLAVSGQPHTNVVPVCLPKEPRSATVWQKPSGWFEPVPGGWRSVNSPWRMVVQSNLFQQSAVNITTPEGIVLKSSPIALSVYSPVLQTNLLLALPKNCIGYLAASNQIVFPDCWAGISGVGVRITLKGHGVSQDLLITGGFGNLPAPEQLGLPTNNLRFQAWTEFMDAPEAQIQPRITQKPGEPLALAWQDERVGFSKAGMMPGVAFIQFAPDQGTNQTKAANVRQYLAPVGKRWIQGERKFLVEELDYQQLLKMQKQLPTAKPVPVGPVQKPQTSLGKPFQLPPELPEHAAVVAAAVPSRTVALQMKSEPARTSTGTMTSLPSESFRIASPALTARGIQILPQNYIVIDWDLNWDEDSDSLPDDFELFYFGDISYYDGSSDPDSDGLDNAGEFACGTNPTDADTDDDGLSDGDEVNTYGTSPTNSDSDNDGLSDNTEITTYNTLPNNPDSDGDGLWDGDEINIYGTNPMLADSDMDGMPDGWEIQYGLDPNYNDSSYDTDADGLTNLQEYQNGTSPSNSDTDGDGLGDWDEINTYGTSPTNGDTDGDLISDYDEIMVYSTNPLVVDDSDSDGMPDGWEILHGFNRLNANDAGGDADNDYLTNLEEYQYGTNPWNADTDADGLWDIEEITGQVYGGEGPIFVPTVPTNPDCDGDGMPDGWEVWSALDPHDPNDATGDPDADGLTNLQEYQYGTSPYSTESDGDSMPDAWEVQYGTKPNVNDAKEDADYDGVSNYQEYLDNTNPTDPQSGRQMLLGRWRFDIENEMFFLGDQGQMPMWTNGVQFTSGVSDGGVALWYDENTNACYLRYQETETNGVPNFNCRSGTIMLWYLPNWTSTNEIGGLGPECYARLFEVGTYTNNGHIGNWQLTISPEGTNLFLLTQTNGQTHTPITAPVYFECNSWYYIALTYSPESTCIYTNGVLAATGSGVQYWPQGDTRTNGFRLGADAGGLYSVNGIMDELKTFNYPLTATAILNFDSDVDGIPDLVETAAVGLKLGNADSDANGIPDGEEDNDLDGLPNAIDAEIENPDTTLPQFSILSPTQNAVF